MPKTYDPEPEDHGMDDVPEEMVDLAEAILASDDPGKALMEAIVNL